MPKTIESTQEPDDTFVFSDDEEIFNDLGNDNMAHYFDNEAATLPKILITTSPGAKVVSKIILLLLQTELP